MRNYFKLNGILRIYNQPFERNSSNTSGQIWLLIKIKMAPLTASRISRGWTPHTIGIDVTKRVLMYDTRRASDAVCRLSAIGTCTHCPMPMGSGGRATRPRVQRGPPTQCGSHRCNVAQKLVIFNRLSKFVRRPGLMIPAQWCKMN